jgi:hypothetical protein
VARIRIDAMPILHWAPKRPWEKPLSLWLLVLMSAGLPCPTMTWAHDFPSSHSASSISTPSQAIPISPAWGNHHPDLRIFIANGEGLTGYPEGGESLAQKALQQWGPALVPEKKLVFIDTREGADIELYWSDQPISSRIETFAHATCQNTQMQWKNSPPEIVHAKMTIGLVHPYTRQAYSPEFLQQMITHEMGHALGLAHTQAPDSIMFYRLSETSLMVPTARDLAFIQLIYFQAKPISIQPLSQLSQPSKDSLDNVPPIEKQATVDTQ